LKVSGDLGRVIFMVWSARNRHTGVPLIFWKEYDLRNTASLEESVRHSDVVYNLVGRNYPTKYVR
jgi:NADH dehydrogenase (ubiquinone) 1 alpha subcomplex subunit 9